MDTPMLLRIRFWSKFAEHDVHEICPEKIIKYGDQFEPPEIPEEAKEHGATIDFITVEIFIKAIPS